MQKFIILNQEDIAQLLTMQDVLAAVEKAYSCKCSKQAELFPLVCHSFEDGYEEFVMLWLKATNDESDARQMNLDRYILIFM